MNEVIIPKTFAVILVYRKTMFSAIIACESTLKTEILKRGGSEKELGNNSLIDE